MGSNSDDVSKEIIDSNSDDVAKEITDSKVVSFGDFPKIKRLDNVQFGHEPKMIDYPLNFDNVFVGKIVDDSCFTPNSEFIRSAVAANSFPQTGVYDFKDGVDNGFNPVARGLGLDPAEIDKAAEIVVEEANKKVSDAKDKASKDAKDARNQRILDNLDKLSESPGNSSENSSE